MLGSVLEYAGRFEGAAPHYQWIVDHPTNERVLSLPSEEFRKNAKAHAVTCRYLVGPKQAAGKAPAAKDSLPNLTDQGIRRASAWDEVKSLLEITTRPRGEGSPIAQT